ncbi:hypothetical protein B0A52_07123 [Exophiala mesophila]|uniref:Extracellular mutant protein 11 C-terminal domain-containing protein n=1 Tax=Exophiala mesophila TaxID=212818 RepID=A0A438MY79_EXOME|nr:hypothetical protein B0A52_07123 [Exophiala mesophila]
MPLNSTIKQNQKQSSANTANEQVHKPRTSVLDDTLTSIHLDDTDSFTNNDYVARGMLDHSNEPNQPDEPLARSSHRPWTFTRQPRPPKDLQQPELGNFGENDWMAAVDRERKLQGKEAKYGAFHNANEPSHSYAGNETYNFDDDEEEDEYPQERPQWIDTPSRLQPAFEPQAAPLLMKSTNLNQTHEAASPPLPSLKESRHDPVLEISLGNPNHDPSNVNHRFKDRRDHVAQTVESEATAFLAPQPPRHDMSSKVSSYPEESSSEEDQGRAPSDKLQHGLTTGLAPSPRGTKRPHDLGIDFSPSTLAQKSFDDLDRIPFWLDPTMEEAPPAVDAHGNTMPLSAKLHNLTKMQVQDQTALFRSQSDVDREATAGWFLERIRDEMQRLMRVRVERRKVALRFEMEVKRRDRVVRTKISDVDEELEGLKKGGTTLIAGRTKPSR